jgi:hypothetical protein
MSDNRDERLETMLRSRHQEAPDPGLAERIIVRARTIPQRQNVSLWRFLRDLCVEFHLPKPAYVLAGALALGMVVGLSTAPDEPIAQSGNAASTQGFFAADEGLL